MTVRLVCTRSDGGTSVGTGFFVSMLDDGNQRYYVIVTNKHVIEGSVATTFRLSYGNLGDVNTVVGTQDVDFQFGEKLWIKHPDASVDLAMHPIGPFFHRFREMNREPIFRSLRMSDIATEHDLRDVSVSDAVTMVGYPIGLWDEEHNLPLVRRGVLASRPHFDFKGKSEFVIDCACFQGSSGSPVFQLDVGHYIDRQANVVTSSRFKLLGLLYAGPVFNAVGEVVVREIPTQHVAFSESRIPIHLGYVIKAWRIAELEPLLAQRIRERSA